MAVKRWVWWLLGAFGLLFLMAATGIGACVYFVTSTVDARDVTPQSADAEFATVRARFKDQKPLLEIRGRGRVIVERLEERAATYSGPLPKDLHLLAWERGESKLVHIRLPMWLLRWKGTMDLNSKEVGLERLNLKVEDIERAGPALLIDHADGRSRLLVWTQ